MFHPRDIDLARSCADDIGDTRQVFVKQYEGLVRHTVRATLKRFRPSDHPDCDVEALAQDIFVCLFENDARRLRTYEGRNQCSLETWLRTIAVRRVLNHLRKFQPQTKPIEDENSHCTIPATGPSAEALVARRQAYEFVKGEIDRLPPVDRLIISMLYEDGSSYEEVAAACHMKKGAVYTRVSRIKNRLKQSAIRQGFV